MVKNLILDNFGQIPLQDTLGERFNNRQLEIGVRPQGKRRRQKIFTWQCVPRK